MAEITGITIPSGARAMLVTHDESGKLVASPVARSESVLNIERDLLKHLNEEPHTAEWLTTLRDYCEARLKARQGAQDTGSVMTPSPSFDWDMTSLCAVHTGRDTGEAQAARPSPGSRVNAQMRPRD